MEQARQVKCKNCGLDNISIHKLEVLDYESRHLNHTIKVVNNLRKNDHTEEEVEDQVYEHMDKNVDILQSLYVIECECKNPDLTEEDLNYVKETLPFFDIEIGGENKIKLLRKE